jgi:hypothetical protein
MAAWFGSTSAWRLQENPVINDFTLDGSFMPIYDLGGTVAAIQKQAADQQVTANVMLGEDKQFRISLDGDPVRCAGFRTALERWFNGRGLQSD